MKAFLYRNLTPLIIVLIFMAVFVGCTFTCLSPYGEGVGCLHGTIDGKHEEELTDQQREQLRWLRGEQ